MNTTFVTPEASREASLGDLLKRSASEADVRSDKLFHEVFREAKRLLELSEDEISEVLLVTRPTVNRWVNGRNLPHPAMRRSIFDWIHKEARRRFDNIKRGGSSRPNASGGSNTGGQMVAKGRW
jgi:hypothetical protein